MRFLVEIPSPTLLLFEFVPHFLDVVLVSLEFSVGGVFGAVQVGLTGVGVIDLVFAALNIRHFIVISSQC